MFFLSVASVIALVIFKSYAPPIGKCGDGAQQAPCDCESSFTLFQVSYLCYTIALIIRWIIRFCQMCFPKRGGPGRRVLEMQRQNKINLSISLIMFTICIIFVQVSYLWFAGECADTFVMTASGSFASSLRILTIFHWLFILVSFAMNVCPCCNREKLPIEDEEEAERRANPR